MTSTLSSKALKPVYKFFLTTFIFTSFHSLFYSQEKIDFEFKNTSLRDALEFLNDNYDVPLVFQDSIPNKIINKVCNKCNREDAISKILKDTDLLWIKSNLQYIVYKSRYPMDFFISG